MCPHISETYLQTSPPPILLSLPPSHHPQLNFFILHTRSKTHKRLKEGFLIRRNSTKRANFRVSPLFQATYNIKNRKTNNSSHRYIQCKKQKNKPLILSCVSCMREAGRRTALKICTFCPIKKRSFNLLCVLDLFLRMLAVNSVSDLIAYTLFQITLHTNKKTETKREARIFCFRILLLRSRFISY